MARHAAAPRQASRAAAPPASKQGPRHGAARTSSAAGVVGRAVVLGVTPAMLLGAALAPSAGALTTEPSLEPEGTAAPAVPTDSALPDAGTTQAQVETVEVTAAPEAEPAAAGEVAPDGEEAGAPAPDAAADGDAVVLDTAESDGRLAGELEVPDGFQTVGLSWPAEIDHAVPEMQVRTRAVDGTWSDWSHLERSTDDVDGGSAVRTSAPVYVGESDAVQLATVDEAATFPAGVELSLVSSAKVATAAASTAGTVAPSATTAGPTVITREEWGAAPRCLEPGTGPTWFPAEGGLKAAAVHHTVNPNDYATVAEAMQAIRNDQAYHQQTHGWCDIGYNFLVDKWGNIYEGADGSIEEPIIGAHTGGFNTGTVGVAMLGTYTTQAGVRPSTAQRDGVAKIIGSRLARYQVNPDESTVLTAAAHTDGGRYQTGDRVTLPRVFGHRDTHRTECPGELAYPVLQQIREQATAYSEQYGDVAEEFQDAVRAVHQDMLGRPATSAEVDRWGYRVAVQGTTVLSDMLETSQQYRSARVVAAFRVTLGYTPSSSQVSSYVSLIRDGGLGVDEVEPYLMWRSSTYYKQVGGTKNSYVTALYEHILRRTPTTNQRKSWVAKLDKLGRQGVVTEMWGTKSAIKLRVADTYRHYVDIVPTSHQVSTWTDRIAGRSTEADLRRTLIGSQTYLRRADQRY